MIFSIYNGFIRTSSYLNQKRCIKHFKEHLAHLHTCLLNKIELYLSASIAPQHFYKGEIKSKSEVALKEKS